jgi:hypothetical protein
MATNEIDLEIDTVNGKIPTLTRFAGLFAGLLIVLARIIQ